MASKFEKAFIESFDESIRPVFNELTVEAIEKLQASAIRTAALIEISLRTPHRAESIQYALKMEQGIVETVLAHAAVDSVQAIRDAAMAGAEKLLHLVLRA